MVLGHGGDEILAELELGGVVVAENAEILVDDVYDALAEGAPPNDKDGLELLALYVLHGLDDKPLGVSGLQPDFEFRDVVAEDAVVEDRVDALAVVEVELLDGEVGVDVKEDGDVDVELAVHGDVLVLLEGDGLEVGEVEEILAELLAEGVGDVRVLNLERPEGLRDHAGLGLELRVDAAVGLEDGKGELIPHLDPVVVDEELGVEVEKVEESSVAFASKAVALHLEHLDLQEVVLLDGGEELVLEQVAYKNGWH